MAAEQGNTDAMNELGKMAKYGEGTKSGNRDYKEAIKWFEKAGKLGHKDAQASLGDIYLSGPGGTEKNHPEAARWYAKAAEQGHAPAAYALAIMLKEGKGVGQNPVDAARWMRRSAELNYQNAQEDLAKMYLNGVGVEQDYAEAFKWFEMIGAKGRKRLISLAVCLKTGWAFQATSGRLSSGIESPPL